MRVAFTLVRALLYAAVFVAAVLVYLPGALLSWLGVGPPEGRGLVEVAGMGLVAAGGGLMLWCVVTFALAGRGTPAPFDPPRRLVSSGPYGRVRNPMYLGAIVALLGAALFYRSLALLALTLVFVAAAALFVRVYEEPTLSRMFGAEYRTYRDRVPGWWPGGRPGRGR